MRARPTIFRWALCVAASAGAALCAVKTAPAAVRLARFAVIYPAADPAVEEKPSNSGAVWLLMPKISARKSNLPTGKKSRIAPNKDAETRIAPLRRQRPKRETSPPTTRRRQLGW